MAEAKTSFSWRMYADATFAGLAVLIPLVPLDMLFEWYFRRRMVGAIARRRGVRLSAEVRKIVNHRSLTLWGCVALPFQLVFTVLKKLSKKILYFLTVKEATDKLSYYWHQAYLLDYMVQAGHLETAVEAVAAREAFDQVLANTPTSPLHRLALEVVKNARHVLGSLRKIWRRGEEDAMVAASRERMQSQWEEAEGYLAQIAERYQAAYEQIRAGEQIQLLAD